MATDEELEPAWARIPREPEVEARISLIAPPADQAASVADAQELASALDTTAVVDPALIEALHRLVPALQAWIGQSEEHRDRFMAQPLDVIAEIAAAEGNDSDELTSILNDARAAARVRGAGPSRPEAVVRFGPAARDGRYVHPIDWIRADPRRGEAFDADPVATLREALEATSQA